MDRRSNTTRECPRTVSGKHLWIDDEGRLSLVAPTVVGLHVHLCMGCGCTRHTIVRPDGSRGRSYKDAN
jgi:hypothetical protein